LTVDQGERAAKAAAGITARHASAHRKVRRSGIGTKIAPPVMNLVFRS
jgi:hypothetical protein